MVQGAKLIYRIAAFGKRRIHLPNRLDHPL
jgi:hypothetical protein